MDIIKLALPPLVAFCLSLLPVLYRKIKSHDFSDLTESEKYKFVIDYLELKKKYPIFNNESYAVYDTFYRAHGFQFDVEFNESIISFVMENRISFLNKELNAFLSTPFLMCNGVQSGWERKKRRIAIVIFFPCCLFLAASAYGWVCLSPPFAFGQIHVFWLGLWGLSVAVSFVLCLYFCHYFLAQLEQSKNFWEKLYNYLNQGC